MNNLNVTDAKITGDTEIIEKERIFLKESLKTLVDSITKDKKIRSIEIENGFELIVPLPEGRSHQVYVTLGRRDADGENLFQIYTICAESNPQNYEKALRLNMEFDYGALAIHPIHGQDYMVMVDTQLIRTAQPIEIEKSILTLAEIGDDFKEIFDTEKIIENYSL